MSPGSGARRLHEFRNQKIRVICDRCGMSRRYDGNAMLATVGSDFLLPELLTRIAIAEGCERNLAPTPNGKRCGLRYG
jgi:RNase P subunit RPR2